MRSSFDFDPRKLRSWREKFERLESDWEPTLTRQLAEEALDLVRETFEHEADPYGKPWRPLVLRSGRILQDSGGLKASFHVKSMGRGTFTIATAKDYAKHHQHGTGVYGRRGERIRPTKARALAFGGRAFASVAGAPARKMVPDRGLPVAWGRRFHATANEVFAALTRR